MIGIAVVDASTVIGHLIDEDRHPTFAAAAEHGVLCAPPHHWVEVVNGLRGLWLGGHLDAGQLHGIVDLFPKLAVEHVGVDPFASRILALRHNLTVYDAAYVALAEHLGAPLITCDRGLASAPGVRCDVLLLEE